MLLVLKTQILENYGAHDWNGEGECPQRWKAKGGQEFKISDIPANLSMAEVVEIASLSIQQDNEYYQESIVSWSMEGDDYLSWYELSQLEYDGEIFYAEPKLSFNQLLKAA
jgi:hypothetical protein